VQHFQNPAPLWYYVLAEAEAESSGGAQLGPVGGRIVAENILGLLQADDTSWINQNPLWQPTLGSTPGSFTIVDVLRLGSN